MPVRTGVAPVLYSTALTLRPVIAHIGLLHPPLGALRTMELIQHPFHREKCAQGRVKESYVGDHRSEGEGGAVEDWSDASSHRHYEEG